MQEFPDGKVGSQVSGKRILTRSLKVVGKILTYGLALSVVGVVVGYNYVMRPQFLEPLIVKQFATHTNGTIELKLEQTSLFRGFKFKNVIVRAPEEYSRTPILQAGEINLLYNVFGFFRGKFGVHEISLKNINIFIEQKKDVMNVQALLKPGKEKEPKEEIEKPESESSVISWFFDVQVFVRFALENFNFTLDARDASNKVKQYAHLKNFHFNFSVLSKDFNSIDTKDTASLVSLLNALVVELNPQKTIDVSYQGPAARITSPIDLSWLLFYDGMAKKPEFMSRMYVGQEKIPVALGARVAQNLSFLLQHKIEYNAKEDKLNVDHFLLKFLGDTVLSFSGSGEKLLTTKRKLQIQTHASRLNLGEVYRVVSTLTGKREPVYSGFFSVKPTRVSIDGNAIEDAGGLKLERVYARTRGLSISIPYLTFDHSASIVQGLKPLPVKRAEAKLAASLNGAPLNFTALLEEKKTAIDFSLRGFNITPFARSQAEGLVSTTLSAVGESPQALSLTLRVFSPQLYYFLDRGRSGLNRFDFTVKGTTRSSENFKQNSIYLPTILLTNKDKEYNSALFLKSRLQLEKAQTTKIVYTIDEFVLGFKQLLNTLPAALRENLGAQLTLLNPGRELKVSGETHVTVAGETVIAHETKWALPDIHIDDIRVKAKARLAPVATYIDEFSITGLKGALRVGANGALKKGSEVVVDEKTKRQTRVATTIPNLRYSVELSQKKENEILEGTHLVGAFTLSGTARGNIVDGKIGIDDLSVRNPKVKIQNVNLDFPFKHDLKLNKTLNLRAGNKERIIKNYNFNRAYNFSIAGIDISDPNNKREWLKIVYPRGNYPAVGASMEYKDNVFVMPVMQMYTLNGVVTISDTLFNLGRLRPKEMEYSSTIQIKDIDLKQLLPSDKAETITDGKLRIDMLFTGNRLDKPIENLNGYISIFRIGPEFADTVMKAVMPKSSSIVTTLAANTTIPKKMDIEFRDGFVYSDIPMEKKIFGYFVPSPEEIKNRRINIPEFFQRISDEASVYRSQPSSSGE